MLHSLTSQLGLIALALVCSLAIAKGGPAERIGALMIAAAWLGLLAAQAATGEAVPTIPLMISDAVLATGFLVLALKYASVWLGAGMIFQATAFALHSMHLAQDFSGNRFYVLSVNVLSYCVLAAVAGGALAGWRSRARRNKERQAEEPLPRAAVELN